MGDIFEEGLDPNDGWNRASVIFGSRKAYGSKVKPEDLLSPSGFGNLRMAGMCVVMAASLTLMYIWPILFFANFWLPLSGPGYLALLVSGVVVFFLFLYLVGTRETQRDRDLAARL